MFARAHSESDAQTADYSSECRVDSVCGVNVRGATKVRDKRSLSGGATLITQENQVGSAAHAELGEQVGDVEFHRALGDVKPLNISYEANEDGNIPLKRIAQQVTRRMEHDLILKVLQANHWNRRKTAEVLKISYRALLYKVRQAGLPSRRPQRRIESETAVSSQSPTQAE